MASKPVTAMLPRTGDSRQGNGAHFPESRPDQEKRNRDAPRGKSINLHGLRTASALPQVLNDATVASGATFAGAGDLRNLLHRAKLPALHRREQVVFGDLQAVANELGRRLADGTHGGRKRLAGVRGGFRAG